jgi:dTDP-4-dehydrorhamnose reductase
MAMNILLFGKMGQVGSDLLHHLRDMGEIIALDRPDVDLGDLVRLERVIIEHQPDVIVNAAAYTAVDQAESDPATAELVNAKAPEVMAQSAKKVGALLVHYSTDYVFAGDTKQPYKEDSAVDPINVYGRTKLEGERAIAEQTDKYLIFRTSWVYSHHGRNFLNTMLRLAGEREELKVVNDQHGTPNYSNLIASATAKILPLVRNDRPDDYSGIYHMTCGGMTTWYDFAKAIIEGTENTSVRIIPIPSSEYPTLAKRPKYSTLDTSKLQRRFGVQLPDWHVGLDQCLRDANLAS